MIGTPREHLLRTIGTVRRRWRLRMVLRGLLIVVGGLVVAVGLAALGLSQLHFAPGAILAARLLAWGAVAALLVWGVLLPLLRQVSDTQVALYIEEHEPELHEVLLSAVESSAEDSPAPALVDRLVRQALVRTGDLDDGRSIDRTLIRRFGGALLGAAGIASLLFLAGPRLVNRAARVLFVPWSEAAAEAPFAVFVDPGDATVPKGGDLDIRASLRGFTSEQVVLLFRPVDRQDWDRVAMEPSDSTGYGFRLFDLQEPMEYLVEAGGVSSPVFSISVTDLPYVDNIDLVLRYPNYTGLGTERIEHGGDVAAPLGTRVTLLASPTMAVQAGRILLDLKDTIPLEPGDSTTLQGSFVVTGPAHYRIELLAASGVWVPASLEYRIDPLDDHGPTISFKTPGRDIRVTAVEEVFAEVVARDDYAIRSLSLVYRLNGGTEDTVVLHPADAPRRPEVSGGHTFFLEEFDLSPGDLVSYYATAVEEGPRGPGRTVTSDIYFMQVRPFGLDYRQAEQQGGGGGGGESPEGLSERQRQIVAGTFKVQRDRETAAERQINEDLATLALFQGRLREQVSNLAGRLGARLAVGGDSVYQVVEAELKAALPEMSAAEDRLGSRRPDEALPPEQKALQHLQRAEAAFREIQVSQGGGGGGGGGGGEANAEELADLFELETDKLRNQYETVERGERQEQQAQEDEAAERLRQLAARQEQENERLQRAAQQLQRQGQGGQGGGGGGRSQQEGASSRETQRQLAEQAEELARQLERLAREQQSDELNQSVRQLQEAARDMRRAAAGGGDGGQTAGERALERIREATRRLENGRTERLQSEMRAATEQVDRLLNRQQGIARDVERFRQQQSLDPQQLRELMERKDSLASAVNALEGTLDRLGRDARRDQGEAARRVAEAAGAVRDNRIADKVRFSKGLLRGASTEYTNAFENQIASNLEEVRDKLADAAGSVGEPEGRRLGRVLDQTGDVRRALESLQDRTTQAGENGGEQGERGRDAQGQGQRQEGEGEEGRQGERGAQGQAPGGQQGQQQGQGQRGQAGGQQARDGTPGDGTAGARNGQPGGRVQPNADGSSRPGWIGPREARQFGREYRAQRGAIDSIRRSLQAEGIDPADLDQVIEGLQALESSDAYRDPEAVRKLQASALEALKNFEFMLRRQVYGEAVGPVATGSDRVPAGFRDAVAEYYRSLARKNPPKP